jgi:hypothetical protein
MNPIWCASIEFQKNNSIVRLQTSPRAGGVPHYWGFSVGFIINPLETTALKYVREDLIWG